MLRLASSRLHTARNIHGDVRRVLLVALQAHRVPARAARTEHGGIVRANDERIPVIVREVQSERRILVDVVPV